MSPRFPGVVGNATSSAPLIDPAAAKFHSVYTGSAPNQQLARQFYSYADEQYVNIKPCIIKCKLAWGTEVNIENTIQYVTTIIIVAVCCSSLRRLWLCSLF